MLYPPPIEQTCEIFSAVPPSLQRPNARSDWADANKPGQSVPSFLEGPVFDKSGNLYLTDIPYGRIFRVTPGGEWSAIAEYDGEPNGMKFHPDGRLWITDYRRGLLALDLSGAAGNMQPVPVLSRRNAEGFKGLNDLCIAPDGTVFFTDQGQTGMHDPTGRLYRLSPGGKLDCLLSNGPSPNGVVLDRAKNVLFIAMTRGNAIWRAPLLADGSVSKVGLFAQLYGVSGPDGLALDVEGNLFVAHASLGAVFVFAPHGECIAKLKSPTGGTVTNLAFGGPENRDLYITESAGGQVLRTRWRAAGAPV
jgi:gluconolactonase